MALKSVFEKFNSNMTKYNPEHALALAKAAELAYDYNKGDTIQKTVETWGFTTHFKMWDVEGTQSYVAVSEDTILAVFAGTNETIDWLDNFTFIPLQGPVGAVHRGFSIALGRVWDQMKDFIFNTCQAERLSKQLQPQALWLTGHSLGGALGTLAVANLRVEEDKPVHGLYTYGSPRVGDRVFARTFNQEFVAAFRIVNNNDIVTRLPARLMLFSHVGNFLYLDVDKKLHNDIGWWYQFLDGARGTIDELSKDKDISIIGDHKMAEYITGLQKNRIFNPFQ